MNWNLLFLSGSNIAAPFLFHPSAPHSRGRTRSPREAIGFVGQVQVVKPHHFIFESKVSPISSSKTKSNLYNRFSEKSKNYVEENFF